MAPRITSRTCVLVGFLNPAILQPAWVQRNKLVGGTQVKVEVAAAFLPPTPGFAQVRFATEDIAWLPALNRLEVQGLTDLGDPGAFVAGLLDLLPHTPVTGVGNNFEFEVDTAAGTLRQLCTSPLVAAIDSGHRVVGFSAGVNAAHGEDAVATILLDSQKPQSVRLNVHRDTRTVEQATRAARSWQADKTMAVELVDRITQVTH